MAEATIRSEARNGRSRPVVWLRVGFCLILLSFLVSRMDIPKLIARFGRASHWELGLLVLIHLAFHTVSSYRWHGLLKCVDKSISWLQVLRVSFASVFMGIAMPGTIGTEVSRVIGVTRSNVTMTKAVLSIALDRMLGTATLALMVLGGLLLSPVHLKEPVFLPAAVILCGVIVLFTLASKKRWRRAAFRLVPKKVASVMEGRLQKIADCIDAFRDRPGAILKAAVLSLCTQFLRVVVVWVCAHALLLKVPFTYLMLIVPMTILMLMLPISIGGLGVREVSYVYLLGLIGVSDESAFALSILLYATFTISTLPGAWVLAFERKHQPVPVKVASGQQSLTQAKCLDAVDEV